VRKLLKINNLNFVEIIDILNGNPFSYNIPKGNYVPFDRSYI
jgi:hypothetical protein